MRARAAGATTAHHAELAGGLAARAGIDQDAELLALLGVPLGLDRTHERVGHERTLEDVVGPRGHRAVEFVIRAVVAGDRTTRGSLSRSRRALTSATPSSSPAP